jgi:hypothetical protein
MSSAIAGDLLRTADFPNGVSTASDVQRLGALLNPRLKRLQALSSGGVNVATNLDASILSFQVTTPATPWWTTGATGAPIALDVAPCFPRQVRINDRRTALGVLLLSCRDHSQAPGSTPSIATTGLQWSAVQSSRGGPNTISIDAIPGLAPGRTYDLTILVLYA